MANKDIVVIGASTGGMQALERLVGALPADLPASLFVVWHMGPDIKDSVLPDLLGRAGPLRAVHPRDGDRIEQGRIYVAQSDFHMMLENGYIRIARGPKENRFRPAIDPLFRSAAYIYGPRVIGVVLSGALDDGTAGMWTIKLRGGTTVVQEPEEALVRSMPLSALGNVAIDYKLEAEEIGRLLASLVRESAGPAPRVPAEEDDKIRTELGIARGLEALEEGVLELGKSSHFTCPDCHGALGLIVEGRVFRFRCHTGHAFTADTLLHAVAGAIEDRLWDAVRAMDESIFLLHRMGEEYAKSGDTDSAQRCFDKARDMHDRMAAVRETAVESEAPNVEQLRDERRVARK